MSTCKPVSFSRRTLHHGVSKYYPGQDLNQEPAECQSGTLPLFLYLFLRRATFVPYCCPHTTYTQNRHPCPRRDSTPQTQQASGRRPKPFTGRPLGSARVSLFLVWFLTRVLRRSVDKQPQIPSGIRIFITMFTTAHYWVLSTAS